MQHVPRMLLALEGGLERREPGEKGGRGNGEGGREKGGGTDKGAGWFILEEGGREKGEGRMGGNR